MNKNVCDTEEVIVWGAFGTDDLDTGANSALRLKDYLSNSKYSLKFWVDNAERKWGRKLFSKEIFPPNRILDFPDTTVVINSLSFIDVKWQIEEMGGVIRSRLSRFTGIQGR